MSDQPEGTAMQEEPQSERGAPGSRDKGEGPAGGPVDRPAGKADHDHDSGVNPQGAIEDDMPELPSGP